jgi:hypothetical protein
LLLTPTPWDDKSFAFLGEVVQGLASIVSFPEDTFDTVTEQIKALNYMAQNQAELVDLPVVLPVADDDEDAKEVTTCNLIFLLTADVPLLLNSHGYSLKQVWEILYPAIVHRNELVVSAPLLNWLRVAILALHFQTI